MGQILGALAAESATWIHTAMDATMNAIAVIFPRLDLIAQSSWLVYGIDDMQAVYFVLIQGGVFMALLFFATAIDLMRRQF